MTTDFCRAYIIYKGSSEPTCNDVYNGSSEPTGDYVYNSSWEPTSDDVYNGSPEPTGVCGPLSRLCLMVTSFSLLSAGAWTSRILLQAARVL